MQESHRREEKLGACSTPAGWRGTLPPAILLIPFSYRRHLRTLLPTTSWGKRSKVTRFVHQDGSLVNEDQKEEYLEQSLENVAKGCGGVPPSDFLEGSL